MTTDPAPAPSATALSALLVAAGFPPNLSSIEPLAGDASTRCYFRLRPAPAASLPSVVVMAYPDDVPPCGELPFLNVHRYLTAARIPVPKVLSHRPSDRLLLLEDVGDATLQSIVDEAPTPTDALPLYERCVEIVVRIQTDGTRALDAKALPSTMAFDVAKLSQEMDFFFEHALRGFAGLPLKDSEERLIEDALIPLLAEIAARPRVLVHRDYHARNLMVVSSPGASSPVVIDFQDARMGCVFYDLASLLRDAYVEMPWEMEERLRYAYLHAAPSSLGPAIGDRGAFLRRLDASAVQRNVKALGTFGYMAHVRGKASYLASVAPTLRHLRGAFDRNSEFSNLRDRLMPLIEAFAEKAAEGAR